MKINTQVVLPIIDNKTSNSTHTEQVMMPESHSESV